MLREIDKDFYCSANCYDKSGIKTGNTCKIAGICLRCENYHRKWPTPEQYKKEYGEDVPDDMPVWYIDSDEPIDAWEPDLYGNAVDDERYIIVIACTPFGKPDDTWRPE